MNEKKEDPGQIPPEQQDKISYPPKLQPVEEVLKQQGFPLPAIKNYTELIPKDLHLAELYRLGCKYAPGSPAEKKKRVNPIQARVDRKGRVWIDVLLERKEGIRLSELRKIMKVNAHKGKMVAGRVLADNLPELVDKSIRLEASRPVASTLYKSVPAIKADQRALTQEIPGIPGQANINGNGVIIGIIDNGCDFKHPNFYNQIMENGATTKKTRILFIWDQNGTGGSPEEVSYKYGTEYTREQINDALKNEDQNKNSYDILGYTPKENLNLVLHGTHVMGIAAGNSAEFPGVAPAADIIFVDLGNPRDKSKKAITAEEEELNTLGSSWNLFNAVNYIFDKADQLDKSAVINISQGTNGGPHDGSSIVEKMFDNVLNEKKGRAIVISAGNSHEDGIHTSGEVTANGPATIKWLIEREAPKNWELRQELEIWYDKNGALIAKLIAPNGNSLGEFHLGDSQAIPGAGPLNMAVLVKHLKFDPLTGTNENHINILIDNRNANPINLNHIWNIELRIDPAHAGNNNIVKYEAWVERNGIKYQSHFAENKKKEHTLNSIGNAELPIVVGSYDAHEINFPIDNTSGEGLSRNQQNKFKPDLSAPGVRIYSAEAGTKGDGTVKTGTSSSAPHVSGVIALMLQAARDRKNPSKILSIREIREILKNSVDHEPPAAGAHHTQYGYGRVNALEAILKTLE
jgi:subtilisin family serine protease